jgi:hypothetical protein
MQALRLPPAAGLDGLALGSVAVLLELGLEQPANTRLAAPSAATIFSGWRKSVSSFVPHVWSGKNVRLTLVHAGRRVATIGRLVRRVASPEP